MFMSVWFSVISWKIPARFFFLSFVETDKDSKLYTELQKT